MKGLARRIAVARGDGAADLLLRGGRLLNVFSGEVERADLALVDGVIAASGRGFHADRVIELDGAFVAPAFIDSHIHLESAMATPEQFARAVVPRGSGAVISDPHEIANVLGLEGVRYMLAASAELPLGVFMMAPSCVPATHLETAGAELRAEDIAELMEHERVLGLAEMMNFPGVVNRDPGVLAKLAAAGGRPVDGHAPGLAGLDLQAYAAAGIGSDHECVTADEARARLALGMHVMPREGSSARNLDDLLPALTPENSRHWLLCSDDKTPSDLLDTGHVDHLLRRCVAAGVPPMTALRMATLNPACYFGLHDRGALLPGRRADIVIIDDLENFNVSRVWHGGELVAEDGALLKEPVAVAPPPARVKLGKLPARPFAIGDLGTARVRVIKARGDQLLTDMLAREPLREDGLLLADPSRDILKLAVVERHRGSGRIGLGFINGFGLKRGALATTVAHDSHNLIVVGADDVSMELALKAMSQMGGGKLVCDGEQVLVALPLPVAGLMSPAPIEETAAGLARLAGAARELGCKLPEPFMTLSFMSLPVIPHLKLTDRGLVDVDLFDFVSLGLD